MSAEFSFRTGAAGTGKTYSIKEQIKSDPSFAALMATNGIAAVNLDAVTINSVFSYFNTESLMELYADGRLTKKMGALSRVYKNIAVDEISMMDKEQLDLFYMAADEWNERVEAGESFEEDEDGPAKKIGIILTGDFCQLPPVKADWAFNASCWPTFERNTTRLTKVWRQENPRFLEAINLAREGKGKECAETLHGLVEFAVGTKHDFDGTTILAKNDKVDRHNNIALLKIPGLIIRSLTQRWGVHRTEWKYIPEEQRFKKSALVMLLSNGYIDGKLIYANGDLGHIVDYSFATNKFMVQLVRTNDIVPIEQIDRQHKVKELPSGVNEAMAVRDDKSKRWIIGGIRYHPMRLAYATTCHKSQGLTLDRVQLNITDGFFGQPNLAYVALSRCRTPEGLRIVGSPEVLARRIKIAEEVRRWL